MTTLSPRRGIWDERTTAEYARRRERLLAAIIVAEEKVFYDHDDDDDKDNDDGDNGLWKVNDDGYVEVAGTRSSRWDRRAKDGSIVVPWTKCQLVTLGAALVAALTWGAGILVTFHRARRR